METPTTSPRLALALLALLLALALTACGTAETTPPDPDHADPCASLPAAAPCLAPQPLDPVAAPPPLVDSLRTGRAVRVVSGTWDGHQFTAAPTPETCGAGAWLVHDYPLRMDYGTVIAAPVLQVTATAGAPYECDGCREGAAAEVLYWTDRAPEPRRLPAERFALPPGLVLYVAVRLQGRTSATVGALDGTVTYLDPQPATPCSHDAECGRGLVCQRAICVLPPVYR